MQVLVDNRFTGLNPANTTVNLYDYTSFKDANGNDEQYNSTNPDNWFNGANNINKDHALTFGNGMNNNMGYWNAGSGSVSYTHLDVYKRQQHDNARLKI